MNSTGFICHLFYLQVGEIVADEDVIKDIESHTDRPHGIAESTFLYTHKNL